MRFDQSKIFAWAGVPIGAEAASIGSYDPRGPHSQLDRGRQPRQSSVAKPALAVARLAPLLSAIIPEDQSADDDGCGRRTRREW